jgi:biopolymer transport protein ExbB/TolQ
LTLFNIVQLVLALGALVMIAERLGAILFRVRIDTPRYLGALRDRLDAGEIHSARRLAEAGRPAWAAELVHAVLKAESEGESLEFAAAETLSLLDAEAGKRLYAIHGIARIASPFALMGVILQLAEGFAGRGSLSSLQAGLVESQALEHALVTLMIGLATTTVCFVAAAMLRRQVRAALREPERALATLEAVFDFSEQSQAITEQT